MIGLVLGLVALASLFFALLVYAGVQIERLRYRNENQMECLVENLSIDVAVMWDKVRAQVLRDAADDWLRVDAEAERKKLSWATVPAGGSDSLVVRWLNLRADKIEGLADDDDDD